jgi:serine/threonine protein phosphatase PrpC
MRVLHPDTASTLLLVRKVPAGIITASVGDSILRCFVRGSWPWSGWREPSRLEVDLDESGHPWQLMGSDICDVVHVNFVAEQAANFIMMMTDGVGAYLSEDDVRRVLKTIGRSRPSSQDLHYLCRVMVNRALENGSRDDASVVMLWLNGRSKVHA